MLVSGFVALAGAGCRGAPRPSAAAPPAPVPVASAEPARAAAAPRAAAPAARPAAHPADVRFMQHMIAHHAQALAMTALVPARSRRPEVRLLAERIDVSQRDELAIMQRWLADRGQPGAPGEAEADEHAEHAGHDTGGATSAAPTSAAPTSAAPTSAAPAAAAPADHARMPGMLTAAELAALGRATGAEFDRLFLTYMTRHHEGALTMVASFFATPGAGQEPQLFGFASDVDADQRAEIARMRALLATPGARGAR